MASVFSALCWKNVLPSFIPQSCQREMTVKPKNHSFLLNAKGKMSKLAQVLSPIKYYKTYRLYRMQTVIVQFQNPSELSEQISKPENIVVRKFLSE